MTSCGGCQEKALQNVQEVEEQVQSGKIEEGDVSDEALAIARGEQEPPTFWGPLSDAPPEVRCRRCTIGGVFVAAALSVLVVLGAKHQGFTGNELLWAFFGAWAAQSLFIAYTGWHPLGPAYDWLKQQLQPDEDARFQFGEDRADTDKITDLPEDYFGKDDRISALEREKRELKEAVHEERGRADEIKDQLESVETELEQLKEAKAEVEEEKEEVVDNLVDVKQKFGRQADFHDFREKASERVQIFQYDEHGIRYFVGWFAGWVETARMEEANGLLEETSDRYIAALVVGNRDDSLGQIPEYADKGAEAIFDYIYPHPTTVNKGETPEVRHPGEFDWRPDTREANDADLYPRVLIQEPMSKVRDARKSFDEAGEIPKRVSLTISYDEHGNYVPPGFDVRGFESRQELRGEKNNLTEENQQLVGGYRKLKNENDRLQRRLTHLNDEIEAVRSRHQRIHEEKLDAVSDIRDAEEEAEMMEQEVNRLQSRNQKWRERTSALETEVEEERTKTDERAIGKTEHDIDAAGEQFEKEKVEQYFRAMKIAGFEPDHEAYTLDQVGNEVRINGSEDRLTKERVVQDFFKSDEWDISDIEEVIEDFEEEVGV